MKTVDIYTTPTCPFCTSVKDFLVQQNVSYSETDITESQENLEEMQKYSGGAMTVPVLIFNEGKKDQEVQIGFDSEKISVALGLS